MSTMVSRRNVQAGMLLRSFLRLTNAAIVVTVVVLFAVPFLLAMISPFIGKYGN